jgi:hypothetical protein
MYSYSIIKILEYMIKMSVINIVSYWIAIITLVIVSSSCTSSLQFTRPIPREIDLVKYDSIVQYVSLYDISKLDFNNEERIGVHESGVDNIEKGIFKSFKVKHGFELYSFDSAIKGNAYTDFPEPLSSDSVKYFCSFNHTPLLLTLDAYSISYDKVYKDVENEEGKTERKADYYLVVYAGLSMYDSTGHLIDRSKMRLKEYVTTKNVIALGASFRPNYNKKEFIDRMSFLIGQFYIDKYFSKGPVESRNYYSSKGLAEIKPYIERGEWEKAIELLLPLAHSNDSKIAQRAAYNLSLLYEAIGDKEKSSYWMEKSYITK